MRVVSHTCSNTEIVCALGCEHLLVGVDDHSDYPVDVVSDLTRVGPDLELHVEAVKALEPDLVLTSLTIPGHEKNLANLQAADLPLLVCAPKSLVDVANDMRRIGEALGVPERGADLAADFERALTPSHQDGRRPNILVEWWPKPVIVPGAKSWVTQLLELAGGSNPLGGEDVESRPVTDDEVSAMQPDAVVMSWCGVEEHNYRPDIVRRRESWHALPALRNNRIYPVTEAWLGRPGPRLIQGLHALRAIVDEIRDDA